MVKFCLDQFYVPELIWKEQIPIISNCLQQTIFIYIPTIYLLAFVPYEVLKIKSLNRKPAPWTLINISKLLFTSLLIILSIIQLFSIVLADNDETFFSAQIVSSLLEIICFVIVLMLTLYQKRKSVHTSGVLFTFWLFYTIFDMTTYLLTILHTIYPKNSLNLPIDEFDFIFKTLHAGFVSSNFLLNCAADYRSDFNSKKSCPRNNSSFLSEITFWWYNPMIKTGYKKPLTSEDMWDLNDEFKTKTASNFFDKEYSKDFRKFKSAKIKEKLDEDRQKFLEKELDRELAKVKSKKVKNVNIVYPFFRTYKIDLIYVACYKLVSILSGFAQPFLLDMILSYVRSNDPIVWKGYFFAICMLVSSAIESILNNQYEYTINEIGMKLCWKKVVLRAKNLD